MINKVVCVLFLTINVLVSWGQTMLLSSHGPVDQLKQQLTTSLSNYNAASADDWVAITQAEFNSLVSNITGATSASLTDAEYHDEAGTQETPEEYTLTNRQRPTPAGHYIYLFRVRVAHQDVWENSKVKISTSETTGYTNYGSTLPNIFTTSLHEYFVLKTPTTATGASTHIAFYIGTNNQDTQGCRNCNIAGTGAYRSGDVSNPDISDASGKGYCFQVYSTATKQW